MTLSEAIELSDQYEAQTSLLERLVLANAVMRSPKGDIAEVGSASGGTTILLSFAAEEVGKHVYSIDPYPESLEGTAMYYEPGDMKSNRDAFKQNILDRCHNVTQYNTDLTGCIGELPELSVAFIDGLHELDDVKREFELLYPKIVSGGMLCLHDIAWGMGQSSNTSEGAVCHAIDLMTDEKFSKVGMVGSNMIVGVKR